MYVHPIANNFYSTSIIKVMQVFVNLKILCVDGYYSCEDEDKNTREGEAIWKVKKQKSD
jgi:hypothetical protein